jgi:hypothetical protein
MAVGGNSAVGSSIGETLASTIYLSHVTLTTLG